MSTAAERIADTIAAALYNEGDENVENEEDARDLSVSTFYVRTTWPDGVTRVAAIYDGDVPPTPASIPEPLELPDDEAVVAVLQGVGCVVQIERMDDGMYRVTISYASPTAPWTALANDLTWEQAMDHARDGIASQLKAEQHPILPAPGLGL